MRQSAMVLSLMVAGAVLLAGCARPGLTREEFDAIYPGQPAWEVQQMLGTPTLREGNRWVYVREDPPARAEIAFTEGVVSLKEWVAPAASPEVYDPAEPIEPGMPEELIDPDEPAEPIEPMAPALAEPVEPMDEEPFEPAPHVDPAEPLELMPPVEIIPGEFDEPEAAE